MKRCIVLTLVLISCASGCMQYAVWKRDIQNDRAQHTYSKAVARQAGEGQLLAIYTRTEEVPLGKKIFNRRRTIHTLALFSHSQYAYRTENTEPYIKHVSVNKGQFHKTDPGIITLTPDGSEPDTVPIVIDLVHWKNNFIDADRFFRE